VNPTAFVLAFLTSCVGALGGLGGAVILVPLLVLTGTTPRSAAPLGLVSVAAGSLAAAEGQVRDKLVNHRIGVTTELLASSGAVAGALASGLASDRVLQLLLAAVALLAAVMGGRRKGIRNTPQPGYGPDDVGEHVGSLSGVYQLGDGYVPYQVRRFWAGSGFFLGAGLLAGLAGASGGFLKTPAITEVMHVPMRVAAATTTFTIGITSAAGLVVFALQDRIDVRTAATVCVGSLLGGWLGARLQRRLSPPQVRRFLSIMLLAVAAVMTAKAFL
jgi:hypothetical protein